MLDDAREVVGMDHLPPQRGQIRARRKAPDAEYLAREREPIGAHVVAEATDLSETLRLAQPLPFGSQLPQCGPLDRDIDDRHYGAQDDRVRRGDAISADDYVAVRAATRSDPEGGVGDGLAAKRPRQRALIRLD